MSTSTLAHTKIQYHATAVEKKWYYILYNIINNLHNLLSFVHTCSLNVFRFHCDTVRFVTGAHILLLLSFIIIYHDRGIGNYASLLLLLLYFPKMKPTAVRAYNSIVPIYYYYYYNAHEYVQPNRGYKHVIWIKWNMEIKPNRQNSDQKYYMCYSSLYYEYLCYNSTIDVCESTMENFVVGRSKFRRKTLTSG